MRDFEGRIFHRSLEVNFKGWRNGGGAIDTPPKKMNTFCKHE